MDFCLNICKVVERSAVFGAIVARAHKGKFNRGVRGVERTAHLISLLSEFVYMWKPLQRFPSAVIQSFYYYLLYSSGVVFEVIAVFTN